MDSLLERRTIRKYTSEGINDDLLNELLLKGTRSSNTGNMQAYSIIVTRDPDMKQKLLPLHFNQKMIAEAPVTLTFCADFNRFSTWCRQRNAEPGYDNFLSFVNAAIDAGTDQLEDIARQRAAEQSDTLMIFLLKGRRPEKYRERHVIEGGDKPVEITITRRIVRADKGGE